MKLWRVSWAQIVNTKIHEISWDFSCMQKCSLFYNSIYCSCLDNDLAWLKDISQNIVNAFFTISYLYAHNLRFYCLLGYLHTNLSKSIPNYHLEEQIHIKTLVNNCLDLSTYESIQEYCKLSFGNITWKNKFTSELWFQKYLYI